MSCGGSASNVPRPTDSALTADGQWFRTWSEPGGMEPRPALFLDRDGVMIEERHYLCDPNQVSLIAGCSAAIRAARDRGFAVVVVSNQSGIGRGLFGWSEHAAVENRMLDLLAIEGATIDASLACASHPQGRGLFAADHPWRKPNPGMLHAAAEALTLQLAHSIIVGDKASDLAAGKAAGLRIGAHVLTGHGPRERQAALALGAPDYTIVPLDSIASLDRQDARILDVAKAAPREQA